MKHSLVRNSVLVLGLSLLLFPACSDDPSGPSDKKGQADPDTIPSEIVTWLKSHSFPFLTARPGAGLDDLRFLEEMVGEASVVSLGEATHGTREFFQMKHRVLEFLVKEMDFNLFAIEATWPEANRLNDYVHTGQGDPASLLSGLYFWTWNTQEVLAMIEWMRAHNQNPGDSPKVSFLGFDMQYPGMAIQNVLEFLRAVDPPAEVEVTNLFSCMVRYSNGPRGFTAGQDRYREQAQGYRDDCRVELVAVQEFLQDHQAEYETASSPQEYSKAHRSARLVIQYEDKESSRTPGGRDLFMAENAIWVHDQGRAGSKIVLWAHNGHVGDNSTYSGGGSMGWHLRKHYSDQMVIVGFGFHRGEFRAITKLSNGSYSTLTDHVVGPAPSGAYEDFFHAAGMERLALDLRGVDLTTPATSWLAGPRLMRSIGAVFTPSSPNAYLSAVSIPSRYDLIIFFDETTAAVGLPFNPPDSW